HGSGLPRSRTIRRISSAASTPDIILPISSGGIAATILAVSLRPSPNGTPGARRRTTAVMWAWNIDGPSMTTALTGGLLASPKVSKKYGMGGGNASPFLRAGNVGPPLQGHDSKRRSFARADPAGRGELERLKDRIELALAVLTQGFHSPPA